MTVRRLFTDIIEINPPVKLKKGDTYTFVEMSNAGMFCKYPDDTDIKEYGRGMKFETGDTVIAKIEPCLQMGRGFYAANIKQGFGSTEYIVFRSKTRELDSLYLYYLMRTDEMRCAMINSMSGATGRQRVNSSVFSNMYIDMAAVEEQKYNANSLSLYDDLIENNKQQIKLLEMLANKLYLQWFVNEKYPNCKNANKCGKLPNGWKYLPTGDVIKFKHGKALKSRENGNVPVYGSSGIIGYHNEYTVKGPAIILGRKGNIGSVYYTEQNCYPIDAVYYAETDLSLYYCLYELKNRVYVNSDSAIPGLNRLAVENMMMVIPDDDVLSEFDKNIKPVIQKIECCKKQIEILTQTRNKLLNAVVKPNISI